MENDSFSALHANRCLCHCDRHLQEQEKGDATYHCLGPSFSPPSPLVLFFHSSSLLKPSKHPRVVFSPGSVGSQRSVRAKTQTRLPDPAQFQSFWMGTGEQPTSRDTTSHQVEPLWDCSRSRVLLTSFYLLFSISSC